MVEIVAAVVSGALGIVAALLGFAVGVVAALIAWWWKARGIRHMLADEIDTNRSAIEEWLAGARDGWPVRSNYIWQSLQALVPGVLSRERVKAAAHFYYRQSVLYKQRDRGNPLTEDEATRLQGLARDTLRVLGRSV